MAKLTVLFIGIDLLLLLSEMLVGLYGGVPSHVEVFAAMFRGPYAYVFWLGQLGLAGALPLVMTGIAMTKQPAAPAVVPAAAAPRRRLGLTWIFALGATLVVVGDAMSILAAGAPVRFALPGAGWPVLSSIGFWIAQVVLIACVVALLAQRWGSPRFWLAAAGLSTVAGILAVRLNIVIPGFVVPLLEHLEQAYHDSRLQYWYFPSGAEWASSIGLVALIVFLFSLAYEILPMYGHKESAR